MTSNNFDYEDYKKSLERILSMCEKDYWTQYIDVNRHQVNVAKTYLWVAVALLGAYAAFYERYKDLILSGNNCFAVFLIISFISAVVAFGLCLYSIPARKGYKSIADPSWGEFSQRSNALLTQKEQNQYISILTELIDRVDSSTYHNVTTNQQRAKLLRLTSWILIISFCLSLIGAATLAITKLDISIKPTQKEATMSTDNNNTTTPAEAPSSPPKTPSPSAEKPNVPTPAGPIGQVTGKPTYTTHGLNPSKGNIRMTEGNEGGNKPNE